MSKNKFIHQLILVTAVSSMTLSACSTADLKNMGSSGSAVSVGKSHRAVKDSKRIKIYLSASEVPKKYKVIGRVSAENYNIIGMEHSQLTITEELKRQAATLGANGIINLSNKLTVTTADAIFIK